MIYLQLLGSSTAGSSSFNGAAARISILPQIKTTSVSDLFDFNQGQKIFSSEPHRTVRKRGRRGGVRERVKRQPLSRTPLCSIILINAQSLCNKTDELQAHVRFCHEFRDTCILAVTETWLAERDLDSELVIDGFGAPLHTD